MYLRAGVIKLYMNKSHALVEYKIRINVFENTNVSEQTFVFLFICLIKIVLSERSLQIIENYKVNEFMNFT